MSGAPSDRSQIAPGFIVITTLGSRWEFWETEHLYRRSPLAEASRERPEWGGPEAGPLQDHVWHPFEYWDVGDVYLRIDLPDQTWIHAPLPVAPVGTEHTCGKCA